MIFYWFVLAVRRIVWLFKIPTPQEIAEISPNARCPVCGNAEGRLRCVWKQEEGPQPKDPKLQLKSLRVFAQHTCSRCGARWFDDPIVQVGPTRVLPSVARDEIEKAEDHSAALQAAN